MTISDKSLIRVQAWTGLLFATFLVLHLANTVAASLGQDAYDRFQMTMRWYYQFPLVEIVAVVGSAHLHVLAGLMRILRRRKTLKIEGRRESPSLRVRFHRYTGWFLMLVVSGHMAATRVPGLMGHPADFSFLNFSLTYMAYAMYPYYVALVLSGLYHGLHGTAVALRVVGAKLPQWATDPASKPFWTAVAVGSLAVLAGVFALGGNLFRPDTARFSEWQAFYEQYVPASMLPWKK